MEQTNKILNKIHLVELSNQFKPACEVDEKTNKQTAWIITDWLTDWLMDEWMK